ncbi:hypothetical protein JIQ42_06434 [Leishmania sp. Namibia]|uniref:hypothetical protein n=1 Tax=Leishmania sp. Namibia TaxID=2802991 RepID=UPI001B7A1006|nr:hypothetical protein JIQ42_06434 [Leishmania sp. Namibia]
MRQMSSGSRDAVARPEAHLPPPLQVYRFPAVQGLASPSTPLDGSNNEGAFGFETSTPVSVATRRPPGATERREPRVRFSLASEQTVESRSSVPCEVTEGRAAFDPSLTSYDGELQCTLSAPAAHLGPYSMITKTSGVRISRWTQVLALLQRTGRQYRRQKLIIAAEVISPLLFVVLLIILSVAFGSDSIPETIFTAPFFYSYQLNSKDYSTYICYNDTTRPIKGLNSCTSSGLPYTCDGDESGIPVSGLCYFSGFPNPAAVVKQYVDSLMGTVIALPSLDSIIVHQWMAKKAGLAKDSRSRTALAALSNVGIGVSATTRFDSISYSGLLYFAPAANVPAALIEYFRRNCDLFDYVYGGVFDTVAEAHATIKSNGADELLNSTWGLIIVKDITEGFDVQVQLHSSALPPLSRPTVSLSFRGGFTYDGTDMFVAAGFLSLQRMLYTYFYESSAEAGALANLNSGAVRPYTFKEIYPVIASYPTIAAETPYLFSLSSSLVAFVMVLSLLYPFAQMTKRMVLEKELCIQETVCIMGLKRSSLWMNFLLVAFFEYTLISILLTMLLCAAVAPRSNPFVIFTILFVYCLTLIPLCGLTSAFFSRARMASLMSPLIYFVLSIPIFAMGTANRGTVIGLSLLSPTALASLLTDVFTVEAGGGFHMGHFQSYYFNPEPYLIMIILACDCVLYLLLMFYVNAVLPQEWGTRKHPLFFVIEPWAWLKNTCFSRCHSRSRSRADRRRRCTPAAGTADTSTTLDAVTVAGERRENGEVGDGAAGGAVTATSLKHPRVDALAFDPSASRNTSTGHENDISVRIDHLCKYFKRNGKCFAAVDNVSWNMYRGEIAVLLGPNGAGKSTTINMITGMLTADSGDCFIEGYSMARHGAEARHEIGYCPQHNILWPDLTCREHLEFYGKIKGLRGAELEDAIVDILRAVDLEEKMDVIPSLMSGGQKRKLSVAIAFVGRSRVVLLDEPTAGMDAAARRHTWSLLRAMTQHHTIMLTTHYMDEADLLGDNIAIVTEGVLQCAGSTAFLRQYAGVGYTLRFDLSPLSTQEGGDAARQAKIAAVWAELHQLVISHLPNSTLVLQTDAEVEYELRLSTEARLPEFLKDMESRGNRQLRIRSYALRAPTLEDVFLRVVEHQIAPSSQLAVEPASDEAPAREQASGDTADENDGQRAHVRVFGAVDGGDTATCSISSPLNTHRSPRSSNGAPAVATSPSVHHSVSRRMSRASRRYLNNESTLNYGDDAEPSGDDEAPIVDVAASSPTQHPTRSGTFGARSISAIALDGGDVAGVHRAGITKSSNASATELRQQASRSTSSLGVVTTSGGEVAGPAIGFLRAPQRKISSSSSSYHERVEAAPEWSDRLVREVVGAEGFRAAASEPLAGRAPTRRHATGTTAPTARQTQQQQQYQGSTTADLSNRDICEAGIMPVRVHCRGKAPCPPLSEDMRVENAWQASAISVSSNTAPAATSVAGAPPMHSNVRKDLFFKDPTDRHLDQVWAVRHTSQSWHLWKLQLRGMMYKRFFYAIRDPRMQFFQIVCPIICVLLAMSLQLVKSGNEGTLYLSPSAFGAESAMQVSGCTKYMGDVAHMGAYGHNLSKVSFSDPNFANSRDMSSELLDTWFTHSHNRFMSLQCKDPDIQLYLTLIHPHVLGERQVNALLYNTSSRSSLPIAVHMAHALAYFGALGTSADAAAATYTMSLTGLPQDATTTRAKSSISSILIGVILLIPFTFLPANPVAWVVKEYESRARHLQATSGLFYLVYWVGNFLFDFAAYVASMSFIIVIFVIFQRSEYIGYETIGATVTAFAIYGACYCCCSYMVSFLFSDHATAQIVVLGVSFLTGFLCVMLVFVLSLLDKTLSASNSLRWIFRLLPPFSIGEVILNLALLEQKKMTDSSLTAWSMSITVWPDIYMAIEAPFFAVVTLLWDHPGRRAIINQLSAWWAARCCRICGRTRRWRRRTQRADQRPRRETIPGVIGTTSIDATVSDTSAPPQRTMSSLLRSRDNDPLSLGGRAAAEVAVHAASGQVRAQKRGGALPMTRIATADADVAGGVVRLTRATLMDVTEAHQSQQLLLSTRSMSSRTNSATLPTPSEMLYPPPQWGRAEALRRREEDSDVEEERNAVYEAERRHIAEQETSPTRPASPCGDSLKPKGSDHDENRQKQVEPTVESCDVVRIVDLRKAYDSPCKVAVSALTFSVMHGEVFGFLGTNGAGKSSALSIITQEQLPTSGRAYVCGYDVVRESRRAAGCLGYCPQFDACLDLLTVTEHLRLYAMVRGVPVGQLDSLVTSLLTICNLTAYRHVSASQLSGGNRRKLSVAIALIGAPKVVCLDEPTSGMDPLARQLLWRVLDRVSRKCSIILTTHHLEEVEALADCVGIMVDGGLRCFGDLPHLKHKYARNAYELTLRVSASARRCAQKRPEQQRQCAATEARVSSSADCPQSSTSFAHGLSNNNQSSTISSVLGRRVSTSYAGNDLIDTSNDIFQFMLTTFPSALLIDIFNNERYVYTLPATRDVADAMQQLLFQQSQGSMPYVQTPLATAKSSAGRRITANAAKKSPPIVRLSEVFETLRAVQAELGITEYSVSQVSLEQVFLRVCRAEETLTRDRCHNPAIATAQASQSTPFAASSNTCGGVTLQSPLLQRQGSRSSFMMQSSPAAMSEGVMSPSRRRLSMPSYGGLPGSTAAVHATFAEYRRQRAMRRLRTEATESHPSLSEQQRMAQPDHENTP